MWGQKCLVSELQPFEISNLGLGHPVDDHVTLRIVNEKHLSKILEIQRQETGFSQQDSLKSVRSEVT